MAIDRGCVYSKNIQFLNRSDGQPIDISTWQFEATVRDEDGDAVLEMSTSNGNFTVFDGPNGWLRLSMTEEQTEALEAGPVTFVIYRMDVDRQRFGKASELVRDPE